MVQVSNMLYGMERTIVLTRVCLTLAVLATSFHMVAHAGDLSDPVLAKHDEFIRLVSDNEFLAAVSLTIPIPDGATDDLKAKIVSERKHYASIVEAFIRDLGPIRSSDRLADQPEDVFYVAWRFAEKPPAEQDEVCYRAEYGYYGPGYAFTISVDGRLIGFAFGLSMGDETARRRWADLMVVMAEIEGNRPVPEIPRRITSP